MQSGEDWVIMNSVRYKDKYSKILRRLCAYRKEQHEYDTILELTDNASEISGRLYHGYSQEPQSFENVVQLIRYMADFYDSIRFPESSVILRKFTSEKRAMEELHEKSVEYQQLMGQNGICATFHIFVKYRQNATWQGSVTWVEKKKSSSSAAL